MNEIQNKNKNVRRKKEYSEKGNVYICVDRYAHVCGVIFLMFDWNQKAFFVFCFY